MSLMKFMFEIFSSPGLLSVGLRRKKKYVAD
jgi:hypothetical protein